MKVELLTEGLGSLITEGSKYRQKWMVELNGVEIL